MAEDNEWEVRAPSLHSLQWPGTPWHRSEQGDLEAGGWQQHRLSVSEASSESDERNGGNVIRLGEDSVREWAGKRRGGGKSGVPLSTVSLSPHAEGRFGTFSWNNRELLYWGMSLLLLWMKKIHWLVSFHPSLMAGMGDSHSSWPPGTWEIARLCCPYLCICRWLGPSKDKRQWKSLSCCGYSCEDRTDLQDHTVEGFFNGELLLFELGSCWAVLGSQGVPECWGQSSHSSAPSLRIRFGVTFLAPALTQVSAHSYQQDLQVALHVCPLGIEIFLNSEHPWPFSSYTSLCGWTIDWYIYI